MSDSDDVDSYIYVGGDGISDTDSRISAVATPNDKESDDMESNENGTDLNEIDVESVPSRIVAQENASLILPPALRPETILTDDRAQFVVSIRVTPDLLERKAPRRARSEQTVHWKGLDWFVLLQFSQGTNKYNFGIFDMYVGYNAVPDDEKSHLKLYLQFQFVLLDEDGKEIATSRTASHGFGLVGTEDRGFESVFESNDHDMNRLLPDAPYRYHGKDQTFYIKVCLQEQFQTELVTNDYNSKLVTGMVGLENLGATCYLNSLLQMLFHINAFRACVYKLPCQDEVYGSSTTLALQNVFRQLQMSDKEVNTQDLLTAFGWTSQDAFAQQDVQEMMRILLDKLEERMKGTVVDGAIRSLFSGSVRSYIKCVDVDYSSNREEDFYDIQLDVKGCKDIYESFGKYIAKEMLDGDNQYDAGDFGKQNAEKGVIFTKFPPVLTILLKRFDFDLHKMRFIKIHDHYEFGTKINLDSYLAEDAPAESKRYPNTYVLHSVLVHMGDVGGGHYYCYIRPSTGYSYQSRQDDSLQMDDVLNTWKRQEISLSDQSKILSYRKKSDRDGKWYKFNDEIVNEVREYEAVNHSFGKTQSAKGSFGLQAISSAYMLVYIREYEAKSIMEDVSIPDDLIRRLDEEFRRRNIEQRRLQRRQIYKTLSYATEQDVANFVDYSRYNDFVFEPALSRLRYIQGSSRYSIILRVADLLRCSPRLLLLFRLERLAIKRFSTIRPTAEYDVQHYFQHIHPNDFYYIHICDTAMQRRASSAFDQMYVQVREQEGKWLDRLRNELLKLPEFSSEDKDGDIAEGCGLYCNNNPILNFIPDIRTRQELTKKILDLQDYYSRSLQDFYQAIGKAPSESNYIGFFKIYDPYNHIPVDEDILTIKLENIRFSTPGTQMTNPRVMSNSMTTSHPNRPYIPLKYIGSFMIEETFSTRTVLEKLQIVLDRIYQRHGLLNSSDKYRIFHPTYEGALSFILAPNGLGVEIRNVSSSADHIDSAFFQSFSNESKSLESASGLFVYELDLSTSSPQYSRMLLPFHTIRSAKGWLQYMATKKTFHVEPLTFFDMYVMEMAIIRRNQEKIAKRSNAKNKEQKQSKQNLMPSMETSDDPGQTSLKRKASTLNGSFESQGESDSNHLTSSQNTMETVDESESDALSETASTSSIASSDIEIMIDTQTNIRMRTTSVGQTTRLCDIIVDLPINITLKEVVEYVHRKLKCAPDIGSGNLALFVCNIDKDWSDDLSYIKPMLAFEAKSLEMFLSERRTNLSVGKQQINSSKFAMSYQILPFNLLNGQNDLRTKIRFLEVLIIDNRIKIWRRRYLREKSQYREDQSEIATKRQKVTDTDSHSSSFMMWPDDRKTIAINPEFIVDSRVFVRVKNEMKVYELVNVLRAVIGIPVNINANGGTDPPSSHEPSKPLEDQKDSSSGDAQSNYQLLDADHRSESKKIRQFDVISEDASIVNSSPYPFALLFINDNVIEDIYVPQCESRRLMPSWVEATDDLATTNRFKLAVQHIPLSDLEFMRGENPSIRSMIVSVFSFTLLGNACNPSPFNSPEQNNFPGPVLTYVREDDDYEAVCRRIALINGESMEEAIKYRLAIVHKKVPTFISRQNNNSTDAKRSPSPSTMSNKFFKSDSRESLVEATANAAPPVSSTKVGPLNHGADIWSLLCEKYPAYAASSFDAARAAVRFSNGPVLRGHIETNPFPSIGIQRSSVASANIRGSRPTSGIKING